MTIGSRVRILPPFAASFPGVYTIIAINEANGAYTLDGIGDFDGSYLELVA